MRVLWVSGLPKMVQERAFDRADYGAHADWSWIISHLPPPPGIELHIASLWPGGSEQKSVEFNGARFHLVPCPKRGRALLLFSQDRSYFQSLFNELKPDIVHGWGTEDSFGLVARQLAPTRHVVGIQGLISEYRKRIAMPLRSMLTECTEKLTLRWARRVVAESSYSLDAARPLCPRARMRVIDHPVREEFLGEAPSAGDRNGILFLGRIEARKGILDAVRIFARVTDNTWDLKVIGSGGEREESAMFQLVDELGIGKRFWHGRGLSAPEIAGVMKECSIFLLPTRIDTGPTALKEALVMGLWPVCYENSGPAEYVRLFRFGTLSEDGNLNDLSEKLCATIRTRPWDDSSRRMQLREFTRKRFSRMEIWDQLIELYEEIYRSEA